MSMLEIQAQDLTVVYNIDKRTQVEPDIQTIRTLNPYIPIILASFDHAEASRFIGFSETTTVRLRHYTLPQLDTKITHHKT